MVPFCEHRKSWCVESIFKINVSFYVIIYIYVIHIQNLECSSPRVCRTFWVLIGFGGRHFTTRGPHPGKLTMASHEFFEVLEHCLFIDDDPWKAPFVALMIPTYSIYSKLKSHDGPELSIEIKNWSTRIKNPIMNHEKSIIKSCKNWIKISSRKKTLKSRNYIQFHISIPYSM